MMGVLKFQDLYLNLGETCRNRILGNVFGINNVSVVDFTVQEKYVIFKIFSQGVFYQYIFDFNDECGGSFIKVSSSKDIVCCFVFVKLWNDSIQFDLFSLLIKIFKCQDEYRIYQLMRLFL